MEEGKKRGSGDEAAGEGTVSKKLQVCRVLGGTLVESRMMVTVLDGGQCTLCMMTHTDPDGVPDDVLLAGVQVGQAETGERPARVECATIHLKILIPRWSDGQVVGWSGGWVVMSCNVS
jgi:hypothetical protein